MSTITQRAPIIHELNRDHTPQAGTYHVFHSQGIAYRDDLDAMPELEIDKLVADSEHVGDVLVDSSSEAVWATTHKKGNWQDRMETDWFRSRNDRSTAPGDVVVDPDGVARISLTLGWRVLHQFRALLGNVG